MNKSEENRKYYEDHKAEQKAKTREYYRLHKLIVKEKYALRRAKLKVEVFSHYSNGIPKCGNCGEMNLEFLTLAHKTRGSQQARREAHISSGTHTWYWAKKHGYPEIFDVLCYPCHIKKDLTFVPRNPTQTHKMRIEELRLLIDEFPLPNGHPLLHFAVENWIEKLREFERELS